jgi:nucleotide-binding universal stress UspA family protein
MERTDIVVGYDGSDPSRAALRYAADEALRRHAPLRIVAAFDHNWNGARFGGVEVLEQTVRHQVETMVDEAVTQTRASSPGLTVSGWAQLGSPAPVLLNAGRTAALIVVGNRGRGGFGALMLGSVGQHVATHAECPVVVVRGHTDTADGPVIVGADASAHGEHTLGVAFEEAARRRVPLIAIRAYQLPVPYGVMAMGTIPYQPAELRRGEAESLVTAVRPWQEKYPDVAVETLVAEGTAAGVLVDVSGKAGLIVVGSHGHGSITGTLLGSISLQVLHHADCPVLVVRPVPS